MPLSPKCVPSPAPQPPSIRQTLLLREAISIRNISYLASPSVIAVSAVDKGHINTRQACPPAASKAETCVTRAQAVLAGYIDPASAPPGCRRYVAQACRHTGRSQGSEGVGRVAAG